MIGVEVLGIISVYSGGRLCDDSLLVCRSSMPVILDFEVLACVEYLVHSLLIIYILCMDFFNTKI